jgi:hypothetical protein
MSCSPSILVAGAVAAPLQFVVPLRLTPLVRSASSWCILNKLHLFGAYACVRIKSVHSYGVIDFKGQIDWSQSLHYLFAHGKMLA